MHTISKKHFGFRIKALHKRREGHALRFLSEKMSFWVAVFSLFAFVTGNMVGQHGWHVFWKSVMGEFDDSLIVYEGTVTPIASVPDYTRWAAVGGNVLDHQFRQVPKDFLVPLPPYNHDDLEAIYSVDHLGSYALEEGRAGSHVGVDIRVPEGTPVRAIANGVVTRASDDPQGFGQYVVIRHPRVPDPENPKSTTTLHSVYAHLSSILISEGMTVRKGEEIGVSGSTGFASGPHLHFQIDRDEAPWHPYWPFSAADMRSAKMNFTQAINEGLHRERGAAFTVNGMQYAQRNHSPVVVVAGGRAASSAPGRVRLSLKERREARLREREERRLVAMKNAPVAMIVPSSAPAAAPSAPAEQPIIVQRETVVSTEQLVSGPQPVAVIEFGHDGEFNRGWEKVRIRLLDSSGRTINSPLLRSDIYLRTAYGKAEFRPEVLSVLDFQNGEAVVDVLPRNRGTVVLQAQPTGEMSAPMKYVEE